MIIIWFDHDHDFDYLIEIMMIRSLFRLDNPFFTLVTIEDHHNPSPQLTLPLKTPLLSYDIELFPHTMYLYT